MTAYVASPALPLVWRNTVVAPMIVAVVLVIRWDRQRTGMFINVYAPAGSAGSRRRCSGAPCRCTG